MTEHLPDRLDLLVRVPLEAMRDVNFPETADGNLRISAADAWPEWRPGNEFKAARDAMLQ